MLRLLAALLSLVVAPFGVPLHSPDPSPEPESTDTPPEAHEHSGHASHGETHPVWVESVSYVPPQPYVLTIDASHMPGERGWFLVPLTTTQPVSLEMSTKHRLVAAPERAQAAAILVGSEGDEWTQVMPTQGYAWRDLEANHQGRRVSCCQQATTRLDLANTGASGGSSEGGGSYLEPGRTLWVGLAADGWVEGSKLKIELTSYGAPLLMGQPVTGTTVEAVDLVDEARRNGQNVRFAGNALAGSPGEAHRTWRPAGTGLLVVDAMAQHDAWGTLTVRVPGEAAFRNERLQDEYAYVIALRAGGPLEVHLTDVREPRASVLVRDGEYGWLNARALYADLSIPLRTYMTMLSPIEYEDEDW